MRGHHERQSQTCRDHLHGGPRFQALRDRHTEVLRDHPEARIADVGECRSAGAEGQNQLGGRGRFLRTEIIEAHDLSVTDAAKILRVSRPTLSSLLNTKADLSAEMALRFETAFGVDR